MEVDDLLSSEYQEKPEAEENSESGVNSYLSQSIIGHDWLWNSEEKIGYKSENYLQEDAELIADEYDLSLADRYEVLSEGKNLQHVYDMSEDKKRNSEQMRLIESHGALGYAGMFATSVLDLPSWVLGAGFGKVAHLGVNAYKIGRTGQRVAQAGAGAATAVASVGLLEASLGNDLTAEQVAINGALGFTLGYAFAGLGAKSPDGITNIQKMADGTASIDMPNQRESFMLPFLHSASDKMKTSDNPAAVEVGHISTRSMSDNGLQSSDTLNDSLRETKTYLTTAKEDWKGFSDEFEKVNGRKLTKADEEAINKIGHKIDHEYNTVKDASMDALKTQEKNKQLKQVQSDSKAQLKDLEAVLNVKIAEIESNLFVPKEVPAPVTAMNRLTQQVKETADSKATRTKIRQDNRNAKARHETKIKKQIKSERKSFEKTSKGISNDSKIKIDAINKSEFDDASLAIFNQHAIKKGNERLEALLKSTDKKYAKAIDIIREFKYKHAMDLKKNDVDGLSGLDESFHWSRQYDADMIARDTNGAIAAFHKALSSNFDKMTKELSSALEEQAKGIVEAILKSKSSLENIDIDKTTIQRVKGQDYGKRNVIGSNLKGRKLRLDGSELTKFMSNDIVGNMTGYSRSIGGRTAVKKILGIDKNNKADKFATDNNFNNKDRELFGTVLEQTYGTFGIDPHMNSVTSKMARALTGVNYINFGGWFGANTLSDLSNIAYDFGLGRTTKYLTGDITKAIKGDKNGKKLARYLGYASESLTNDRAILYGADEFAPTSTFAGERAIAKGGALMSKLSGMNMVVDLMDRVTSFASMDYILKGVPDDKFIKTMNRLGLDMKTVNRLRSNKDLVKWDKDAISEVNFDSLSGTDKANLERGLRRAISDVVLKGGDLDSPEFLTRILGSHSLAKALFQFMRFPVIAYNKLGRKMLNNFDAIDGVVATATGAAILGLTTQLKDIGKTEPRYDLDTKEGQLNSIKFIIERMPHLAAVGLVQSQADILGRVLAQTNDEDYKSYGHGAEMGVTIGRMNDVSDAMGRFMNGEAGGRDAKLVKSFLSTNLAWIQPLNNVVDDKIMGR